MYTIIIFTHITHSFTDLFTVQKNFATRRDNVLETIIMEMTSKDNFQYIFNNLHSSEHIANFIFIYIYKYFTIYSHLQLAVTF